MPVKKVGDKWEVRGKEYSTEEAANKAYKEYLSEAMGVTSDKDPIHIKPSHKGKFTKWAKSHGFKTVQEAASHVLANKDKYSEEVQKMAQFAHNSKSWN